MGSSSPLMLEKRDPEAGSKGVKTVGKQEATLAWPAPLSPESTKTTPHDGGTTGIEARKRGQKGK